MLRKRREESAGTRGEGELDNFPEGGEEMVDEGEEMPGPRRRPGMDRPGMGGQGDFPDQGFEPPPEPPDGGWNQEGPDMPPGEGGPNFEE